MLTNVTRKTEGLLKNTLDMKIVIGLLMVSSRSDAEDVNSGSPRAVSTEIANIKMVWRSGARNVQIKPQTSVVSCGVLC